MLPGEKKKLEGEYVLCVEDQTDIGENLLALEKEHDDSCRLSS